MSKENRYRTIQTIRAIILCGAPPGSEAPETSVELPVSDRVVNVPLNLLFQRLVTGETEEISFQVLLCRFGARLFAMTSSTSCAGWVVDAKFP